MRFMPSIVAQASPRQVILQAEKNSAILRSLPKPLEPIRTLAHRVQE